VQNFHKYIVMNGWVAWYINKKMRVALNWTLDLFATRCRLQHSLLQFTLWLLANCQLQMTVSILMLLLFLTFSGLQSTAILGSLGL
jgi:hypothetical protein